MTDEATTETPDNKASREDRRVKRDAKIEGWAASEDGSTFAKTYTFDSPEAATRFTKRADRSAEKKSATVSVRRGDNNTLIASIPADNGDVSPEGKALMRRLERVFEAKPKKGKAAD